MVGLRVKLYMQRNLFVVLLTMFFLALRRVLLIVVGLLAGC